MKTLLNCGAWFLVLIATALLYAQKSSEIDPMLGADNGGNVFVTTSLLGIPKNSSPVRGDL